MANEPHILPASLTALAEWDAWRRDMNAGGFDGLEIAMEELRKATSRAVDRAFGVDPPLPPPDCEGVNENHGASTVDLEIQQHDDGDAPPPPPPPRSAPTRHAGSGRVVLG